MNYTIVFFIIWVLSAHLIAEPAPELGELQLKAESGDAVAQFKLGMCYSKGEGVPKNHNEAVKWVRKAAESGHILAQCCLAELYDVGIGVPKDQAESLKWFRKAAEQGNPEAQYNVGIAYYQGAGIQKHDEEAVKWFQRAAEQGFPNAQYILGASYASGEGVVKDEFEAIKWYQKAANQGFAPAQANLGACYSRGIGVNKDETEATAWYRKSAEQGYAKAQLLLGLAYSMGIGASKNYVESYKWLALAAATGDETTKKKANVMLVELEKKLPQDKINLSKELVRSFKPQIQEKESQKISSNINSNKANLITGTGFFITENGYFITSKHIVKDSKSVKLVVGSKTITANIVKLDHKHDLALLKAEGYFTALSIGTSKEVKMGSSVSTIGFPNIDIQGFSPKFSRGDIASLSGINDDSTFFQVSVPIQPGNSGGALLDDCGNVVGVVCSKLSYLETFNKSGAFPENVGYAIKSGFLLGFLESTPELSGFLITPSTNKKDISEGLEIARSATALVIASYDSFD